jgi:hypothetical protein
MRFGLWVPIEGFTECRYGDWHGFNSTGRFGPSPNRSPQCCRIQVNSLLNRLFRQRCGELGTWRSLNALDTERRFESEFLARRPGGVYNEKLMRMGGVPDGPSRGPVFFRLMSVSSAVRFG